MLRERPSPASPSPVDDLARAVPLVGPQWRGARQPGGCARPRPAPPPKALSVEQAVSLASFRGAQGDPRCARDHRMVEAAGHGSGLRVAELVGLNLRAGADATGWIDAADASAQVLGKGQQRRTVPVGAPALAPCAWLAVRRAGGGDGRTGALRQPARHAADRQPGALAAEEPGLCRPGCRRTCIRTCCATASRRTCCKAAATSAQVQELLGHANISTTQVYTRLDFQHLARSTTRPTPGRSANDAGMLTTGGGSQEPVAPGCCHHAVSSPSARWRLLHPPQGSPDMKNALNWFEIPARDIDRAQRFTRRCSAWRCGARRWARRRRWPCSPMSSRASAAA